MKISDLSGLAFGKIVIYCMLCSDDNIDYHDMYKGSFDRIPRELFEKDIYMISGISNYLQIEVKL